LSTRTEIPLSELKGWLENQTAMILKPLQTMANKLLDNMRKAHNSLIEACEMLMENSRKEIEKRNMRTFKRAQALNKLAKIFLERMRQVHVPEKPCVRDFEEFVSVAQKAYAITDVDVRNWFPRISPFFIMDRGKFLKAFEEAKGSLKELTGFLTKEYVRAKTLEETFQLIDEISRLRSQLSSLEDERRKAEMEKARLEMELTQIERQRGELESVGGIAELAKINETVECLRRETAQSLKHLQKPLLKLQSLTLHGSGSLLTLEETKRLNEYLEDPFEALATENVGYPILRRILHKTARLMAEGKLKLKPDKARKAKQSIEEIVEKNSLANLHQKCVEAKTRRNKLLTSQAISEAKAEVAKLKENAENIKKRLERLESEIAAAEKAICETVEKVGNCKGLAERHILDFSGREVIIVI